MKAKTYVCFSMLLIVILSQVKVRDVTAAINEMFRNETGGEHGSDHLNQLKTLISTSPQIFLEKFLVKDPSFSCESPAVFLPWLQLFRCLRVIIRSYGRLWQVWRSFTNIFILEK